MEGEIQAIIGSQNMLIAQINLSMNYSHVITGD